MKKFAMALVAGALLSVTGATVARAHEDGKSCPMCECKMDTGKKADKLGLVLGLNDKQKGQVKDLLETKKKSMEPAMKQMQDAHKAASDNFKAGLKNILTPAQWKKFEEWKDTEEK